MRFLYRSSARLFLCMQDLVGSDAKLRKTPGALKTPANRTSRGTPPSGLPGQFTGGWICAIVVMTVARGGNGSSTCVSIDKTTLLSSKQGPPGGSDATECGFRPSGGRSCG